LESSGKDTDELYLHLGPSGDCWTGASIFAAKHLQPDYVRSVPLRPPHVPENICTEKLLEILEVENDLAQEIYDSEILPKELLERIKASADKAT
jgi:hypothetical protein